MPSIKDRDTLSGLNPDVEGGGAVRRAERFLVAEMGGAVQCAGGFETEVPTAFFAGASEEATVAPASSLVALVRRRDKARYGVGAPGVVGRGAQADVRIQGNLSISREHLRIERWRGHVLACDLGSRNRTWVNGIEVSAGRFVELCDGDVLTLADEDFEVSLPQAG